MIKSFRDPDAQRLFDRRPVRRFGVNVGKVGLRKLRILDMATTLGDLRVSAGNHVERLRGDRAGRYGIRINDQFRICFRWRDGDAYNVEIVDYHEELR